MTTLIIKSNVSQGIKVLIKDLGITIPPSGGSETFVEMCEIYRIQESKNLRDFLLDDAFGIKSSTLILNDGSNDIDQDDVTSFLATLDVDTPGDAYGLVRKNAQGQVFEDVNFDGTATVSGMKLGSGVDGAGNVLSNFGNPVDDQDLSTKAYVDNSWSKLSSSWSTPPSLVSQTVNTSIFEYRYLNNGAVRVLYRTVPLVYSASGDAFYMNFDGTSVTGLVATRGVT
jgi:hypothetical protein